MGVVCNVDDAPDDDEIMVEEPNDLDYYQDDVEDHHEEDVEVDNAGHVLQQVHAGVGRDVVQHVNTVNANHVTLSP